MSEQKRIIAGEFANTVAEGVVVVKFGAEWCNPCKVYDAAVVALIEEFGGRVGFYSVDAEADENSGNSDSVSMKRRIGDMKGYPYVTIFKDGELQDSQLGLGIEAVREKILAALTN
jgi:thioredoxin 1